jgi:nicotinamidase-related amidase
MDLKTPLKDAWEIIPDKTALLIVDMQRAFVEEGGPMLVQGSREFVPRLNELANICRRLRIPVIFIRMMGRADLSDIGLRKDVRPLQLDNELEILEGRKGVDFCAGLEVTQDDYVVPKIRYSAFIPGSSSLELLLRGLDRDRFIICGICTDICVAATTMDAMMLGFKVFFVGDLTATLSDERQRVSLEVLDRHFAKVMTFEQVKNELQLSAGRL